MCFLCITQIIAHNLTYHSGLRYNNPCGTFFGTLSAFFRPFSRAFSFNSILKERIRINQSIRALELRVIGADGANVGVISRDEAMRQAREAGLDLIEISPHAQPPVAKIMDFGKFQYEQQKKAKEVRAKSHTTETKGMQVKIGTGEHDLALKARRVAQWLTEGNRVKVDLFLWGRYKYMAEGFLKERLERFLKLIPTEYKIAEVMKRSPKGFSTTVEKVSAKSVVRAKDIATP